MRKGLEAGWAGRIGKKKILAKPKTHRHTWELFYFQQVLKAAAKPGNCKQNPFTPMFRKAEKGRLPAPCR